MLDAIQRRLLAELFATLGTPETVNQEPPTDTGHAISMVEESESWRVGIQWPNGQWLLIVPSNEGNSWVADYSLSLEPTIEALLYPASLQAAAADLYEAARFYSYAGSCLYGLTDRAADCGCDWHLCCHAVTKAEQEP